MAQASHRISARQKKELLSRLTSAIRRHDTAGTGEISVQGLQRIFAPLGITPEALQLLVSHAGCFSREGRVIYADFFKFLCCEQVAAGDPQPSPEPAADGDIPCPPLAPETPCTPQVARQWKEKYTNAESILAALDSRDTVLVKGSWLVEYARSGKALPRRQELPAEAIWDHKIDGHDLLRCQDGAWEKREVIVAALSYCWATPAHPDPNGEQSRRVAHAVDMLLTKVPESKVKEVALFIDWCSLYQNPRDDEQNASFKRALSNVNLWYAHGEVLSFLLTVVPEGVKPYKERGWPSFEYAISGLVKDSNMCLDLGELPDPSAKCETYREIYANLIKPCRSSRPPPITPASFHDRIKTLHFTNGADRAFVMKKYLSTFEEVMGSAEKLVFTRLSWHADEAKDLASCLSWCRSLQTLDVTGSEINTEGVLHILAALKDCPTLTTLDLERCKLGDGGLARILESLEGTGLRNLFLAKNGISDAGAGLLAAHLEAPSAQLVEICLRGNEVTDVGAARLAAAIRCKSCPLELIRFAENGVGDEGAKALAEAAKESSKLRVLDLRRTDLETAGRESLEEAAEKRRPHLTIQL